MSTEAAVSFRMATADDAHLPTYDNTKLVALNTCPTYGILRYQMHKRMSDAGRMMALECGKAMHEVFAWVRLCTLRQQLGEKAGDAAWLHHGERLFAPGRFDMICEESVSGTEPDYLNQCKSGAISVLATSGFYDDARDKKRTLSTMEEAAFAYIDRWRWDRPVWMRDILDPCGDVGIEIPFDIVVETTKPAFLDDGPKVLDRSFRITGKIDGIHVHNGKVTLHENKTASRLNDAWSMSFALSSQITHYCLAASVFTQTDVRSADVLGLSIPLPKSYDYGGFLRETVMRHDYHFKRWIDWLLHTVDAYEKYADNPYDAPKYTHSCSRYFRPCSMLPFCDSDDEEQRVIVADMVDDEWSPLHEVVEE